MERIRVVFLGDSVTCGYGLASASTESYVPLARARLITDASAPELLSSAYDGIDTAYALKRFDRMVTSLDPDWVAIYLGLNDAISPGSRTAIPPIAFEQNLLALVDRIMALGAHAALVAPNPRFRLGPHGSCPHEVMGPYVDALRDVARQTDIPCVDVFGRFMASADLAALLPDGVHPSAAGHEQIVGALAADLPCLWPYVGQARQSLPAERAARASLARGLA